MPGVARIVGTEVDAGSLSVSVIVPTHDRVDELVKTLGNLSRIEIRSDRTWVQDQLRSLQGQYASRFRKPLVPADQSPDFGVFGLPNGITLVSGTEVILFRVSGGVGDVRFTVSAQD